MEIDVSLVGWILAVVSFMAGTIVPVIYNKLAHEGIAIRQPYEYRAFSQDKSQKRLGKLVFQTLLKVANAKQSSILIDDIRLRGLQIDGVHFKLANVELKNVEPGSGLNLPLNLEEGAVLHYLPIIVKSNEERTLAIEFELEYSPKDAEKAFDLLSDQAETQGIKVDFRINGKYRGYVLTIGPR